MKHHAVLSWYPVKIPLGPLLGGFLKPPTLLAFTDSRPNGRKRIRGAPPLCDPKYTKGGGRHFFVERDGWITFFYAWKALARAEDGAALESGHSLEETADQGVQAALKGAF